METRNVLLKTLIGISLLAALGNAVICTLYIKDNHWAEEYGLGSGIVLLGLVTIGIPFIWKKSKSLVAVAVTLSMPMMLYWVKVTLVLATYMVRGDT